MESNNSPVRHKVTALAEFMKENKKDILIF